MSSDEEPDELVDLNTVDEQMEDEYKRLMDVNAEMIQRATVTVRKLLRMAARCDEMAERYRAAATLVYVTASQLTMNAGDLLSAEFGIEVTEVEPGEIDDDSEDEDEEDE